jgi:hypothetical protein
MRVKETLESDGGIEGKLCFPTRAASSRSTMLEIILLNSLKHEHREAGMFLREEGGFLYLMKLGLKDCPLGERAFNCPHKSPLPEGIERPALLFTFISPGYYRASPLGCSNTASMIDGCLHPAVKPVCLAAFEKHEKFQVILAEADKFLEVAHA